MMRMREHIDRLYLLDGIFHGEQAQVACLCRRVAAHINDTFRLGKEDRVDHVVMHAGTGRVCDDNIRTAVLVDEILCQDVFHVSGIEQCIFDLVQCGVDFGVFDCFGHIFDADHFLCLAGDEVGDRAGSGLQVVNHFVSGQPGKLAGNLIQLVSLFAVGLVE